MFGWFSGNKIYRSEIYENEFFRLHEENAKLKKAVEELEIRNSKLITRSLTKDLRTTLNGVEQGGVIHVKSEGFDFKPFVNKESNLLEIKLKDTDSVPEVWYKGKRLDGFPNGLVELEYRYSTADNVSCGEQSMLIEYYDGKDNHNNRFGDKKIIGHERVGG